jgi:hypothetical protein
MSEPSYTVFDAFDRSRGSLRGIYFTAAEANSTPNCTTSVSIQSCKLDGQPYHEYLYDAERNPSVEIVGVLVHRVVFALGAEFPVRVANAVNETKTS